MRDTFVCVCVCVCVWVCVRGCKFRVRLTQILFILPLEKDANWSTALHFVQRMICESVVRSVLNEKLIAVNMMISSN